MEQIYGQILSKSGFTYLVTNFSRQILPNILIMSVFRNGKTASMLVKRFSNTINLCEHELFLLVVGDETKLPLPKASSVRFKPTPQEYKTGPMTTEYCLCDGTIETSRRLEIMSLPKATLQPSPTSQGTGRSSGGACHRWHTMLYRKTAEWTETALFGSMLSACDKMDDLDICKHGSNSLGKNFPYYII